MTAVIDALTAIVGPEHVQAEIDRPYLEEAIGNEIGGQIFLVTMVARLVKL